MYLRGTGFHRVINRQSQVPHPGRREDRILHIICLGLSYKLPPGYGGSQPEHGWPMNI